MGPIRSLTPCLLAILFLYVDGIQGQATPPSGKVVTCYIASWAKYRPDGGKFTLDDLQPEYCTHLIYAFAGLNNETWKIQSIDTWADLEEGGTGNYRKLTALRNRYPGLKVLLALGGWNEGSENYSRLVSDQMRRLFFAESTVNFLKKYGFQGLDLDWEFPTQRGGSPGDRENFTLLVRDLSTFFRPNNLLLTAAISANMKIIDSAYDIPEISRYLDYIHVMAYDYHGSWEMKAYPNAPLYADDDASVNATIRYLLELEAPPEKLVLGLPMYGRTFTVNIESTGKNPIGMFTQGKGFSGPYTREDGIMGYNEICKELKNKTWTTGWDPRSNTSYAVNDRKVILYDDYQSLQKKVLFSMEMNLAGVMVWSIDTDDFTGTCGTDYMLIKSINKALANNIIVSSITPKSVDEDKNNDATSHLYNVPIILYVVSSFFTIKF